jgi:hypothetical protein
MATIKHTFCRICEPLSNMSHMNGVPVEVEKEGALNANSASPRARGTRGPCISV